MTEKIEKKELLSALLKSKNVIIPPERKQIFDRFLKDDENNSIVNGILKYANQLMDNWRSEERVRNVMEYPLRIPNATTGKPYEVDFDLAQTGLNDITDFKWQGLREVGLDFDRERNRIQGVPERSGDIPLLFLFKVNGQKDDSVFFEKPVTLIVNPDPRTLWKTLDSDKDDPFAKEDDVTLFAKFGDRHILVSSKRGRSHANVGSFREDDFSFHELKNGWNVIAVADGAGSAKLSRKGSSLACASVIEFFSQDSSAEVLQSFDVLLEKYSENAADNLVKELNRFVYNLLGQCALTVHKRLESFAAETDISLKDLSTTLIFTLIKKYDSGYALLSFGVGDCPIAVLNKELSEVTLMNWIDVGEYGGGTRFVTMPEIFKSDKFATRFGFKHIRDFSYLMMMSDGIYDPKFVVESALPDINKWKALLEDLSGNNKEGIGVELNAANKEIEKQFSAWMDFWSPGNHDDRTLAIVF